MLDTSQIESKKAPSISHSTNSGALSTSGKKDSDFSRWPIIKLARLAYKNIEKLLPFYNKATIVKYEIWSGEQSLYQKNSCQQS